MTLKGKIAEVYNTCQGLYAGIEQNMLNAVTDIFNICGGLLIEVAFSNALDHKTQGIFLYKMP